MTSYEGAASGWEAHLRAGGTSTWSGWLAGEGRAATSEVSPPGQAHPEAAHLELVRRLNQVAGESLPRLVDVVLTTGVPGRGRVDVPLPWKDPPRFGTPPAQPETLPAEELARLAVGVLGRLLPEVPAVREVPDRAPRPLPWRRRVQVHGSPGTASALRAGLRAHGVVDSGKRATQLVVARPLDLMMAEHWHAETVHGSALKWWRVWRRAVANDAVPTDLDPAGLAARLAGSGRAVHVVVAADHATVSTLTSAVLGRGTPALAAPADPAETDLIRRLNRLLAQTQGVHEVPRLTSVLRRRVLPAARATLPGRRQVLTAPPWASAWAVDRARTMAEDLRRAGYAVHGDPGDLVPRATPASRGTVDRDRTLGLALAACLRAWQLQEGTR